MFVYKQSEINSLLMSVGVSSAVPGRSVRPGSGRHLCHGGPRPGEQEVPSGPADILLTGFRGDLCLTGGFYLQGSVCESSAARRSAGGEVPPGRRK